MLNKQEIEQRIVDLKSDYVRIQGDLEKMEAVVGNSAPGEKALSEIEEELKRLRKNLQNNG